MKRSKFALIGLTLLAGCYSYQPLGSVTPERGAPLRVLLDPPQDARLLDYTVNAAVRIEGELIELRPDQVLLSAFGVRSTTGFEYLAQGETVELPRQSVTALEVKRVSPVKTALFAGATGVVLFSIDRLISGLRGGGGGSGGPGGGQPR
jgi:hypothetical protein